MKVIFFSESNIKGKVPRDFENARTEFGWSIMLDAEWCPLNDSPTEKYDLGSCYDPSSNQRFTPTTAGKYICYLTIMLSSTNNDFTQTNLSAALYKNGSGVYETHTLISGALWKNRTLNVTAGIDFNGSSDYLEAYGMADSTTAGSTNARGGILGSFGAYKIIE